MRKLITEVTIMKFPLTILFTLVIATLIQGTMIYGWISDNLFFTYEKMGALSILGLTATGIGVVYTKLLSASIRGFWSLSSIIITALQLINFAIFLGFMYLVIRAWTDISPYIE